MRPARLAWRRSASVQAPTEDEGVHGNRSTTARQRRSTRSWSPSSACRWAVIGLLREVKARRRRARIELALPVAAWPGSDELADEVHRVARGRARRRGDRVRSDGDARRRARRAAGDPAPAHVRGHGRSASTTIPTTRPPMTTATGPRGTATAAGRRRRPCSCSRTRPPGSSGCRRARAASASRR